MNPRAAFLTLLGWCPGVKAAAKFVPDRDIPPRRIFAFALVLTAIVASTYMIAYTGLTLLGFPSANTLNVNQFSPKLVAAGDEMYLAAGLEVGQRGDFVENRKIYLTKLTIDGQALNLNEILDTGGYYLSTYNIIRTDDGEWFTVYQTYTFTTNSDLKLIHSSDGAHWEAPYTNNNDVPATGSVNDASLVEAGNGDYLLFYTEFEGPAEEYGEGYVTYMVRYSPQEGWGDPERTPFNWMGVSSFRNVDGGVYVVGVVYAMNNFSSYLARLLEDGSWSEPIDLNYTGSSRVDILYSESRDMYFLLGYGTLDNKYVQVCSSRDLRSLDISATYASAQNPSLAELANGTLVIAYERVHDPPYGALFSSSWTELYVASSVDGVSWMNPHRVEGFMDEAGLNAVSSGRRFLASAFLSIIASFILVFLILKKRIFHSLV